MRDRSLRLEQRRLKLGTRRKLFTTRVVKYRSRLPRGVVEAPSL